MHWILAGQVDTFQGSGSSPWQHDSDTPDGLLKPDIQHAGPRVLAAFLQAQKVHSLTQEEIDFQKKFCDKFAIPKWLWQAKEQDSNGYFYGASLPPLNKNPLQHVSVFRFMIKYVTGEKPEGVPTYDWHILTFVTYFELTQKSILLCFNIPKALQGAIQESMRGHSAAEITAHPFILHGIILEHVVELYDKAIWQFRDYVRRAEQHRPTIENPRPDYAALHELGRHVMHSSEVLSTALNVINNILDEHDRVQKRLPDATDVDPGPDLRHKRSMLHFMHNRSEALGGRLTNEIGLAFHITAQHSSETSAQIAQAAKVDSFVTKTISILGLLFLPGTFVSAIFSMSFFNFTPATESSPAHWSVSEKLWIYFVVAIPVTAVTVAMWFWWQMSIDAEGRAVRSRHLRGEKGYATKTVV